MPARVTDSSDKTETKAGDQDKRDRPDVMLLQALLRRQAVEADDVRRVPGDGGGNALC
jgi:hypothetical protein